MAEAMALAGLLSFCFFINLQNITIFGDSKVLVDYLSRKNMISRSHLVGWLDKIRFYWNSLMGSSIHHINRDQNQKADELSKKGLQAVPGSWHLQVSSERKIFSIQDFYPSDF